MYPDRRPYTGLLEYKNVHRPVRVTAYHQQDGLLTLRNEMNYVYLQDYVDITYEVSCDGQLVARGAVDLSETGKIRPRTEGRVPLAVTVPEQGRCYLKLFYHVKQETEFLPKGYVLGFDEIRLENRDGRNQRVLAWEKETPAAKTEPVTVEENELQLKIQGNGFVYTYSKLRGIFEQLEISGQLLLDRPMEMNVWRAPTDNGRQIRRYVYVYLITGKYCYLIDSGVAGSEKIIAQYMKRLGRSIEEIKAVFLTHSHPDHIGGAAEIQEMSGRKVYCSGLEREWAENIETQFQERPIPNFYTLVQKSVGIDEIVTDQDTISLEPGITIRVAKTPGHSQGSVSYVLEEKGVLFSGDAIPDLKGFPVFTDEEASERSLETIYRMGHFTFCCPAWDRVYRDPSNLQAAGEICHTQYYCNAYQCPL